MGARRCGRIGAALALVLGLAGCASLPRSGPTAGAILQTTQGPGAPFRLVDLTLARAARLDAARPDPRLVAALAELPPPRPPGRIVAGDLLRIVLWEANPTGTTLLTPPGLDTTLPVGASGVIDMPYVGALRVAGRSPRAVQTALARRFAAQGDHIQVAVRDIASPGNEVIVAGAVARPGRYPLGFHARRVLDLIALAGGAKLPAASSAVRISRDGRQVTIPLAQVIAHAALDPPLGPGDRLMVLPDRRFFYAFGAVNRPGARPYLGHAMSLTTALGAVAGLQDDLATPRGVFVYRRGTQAASRVVYRLDLSRPDGFFVADRFRLRPGDVLYVSDAPVADVAKVLQVISGVSNLAAAPRNFGAPY